MKEIDYKGEVLNYCYNSTTIYNISCLDYYHKRKKFKSIEVNEIYESHNQALIAIKNSASKLKTDGYCFLLEESDNRYKIIFKNNKEEWITRTYTIDCIRFNNKELEKRSLL